ncbi:MAG: MATE family efflux transporter [Akkermansia sp.]
MSPNLLREEQAFFYETMESERTESGRQWSTAEAKRILLIMLPLFAANVMQLGMGVIDTVVAGKAGATDLAGVGLAGSLSSSILVLFGTIISILSPTIAKYCGAGESDKCGLLLNSAKWAAGLLIIPELLCIAVCAWVFPLVSNDEAMIRVAERYLLYLLPCVPAHILLRLLLSTFEGYGQTRPGMLVSLLGLLVNIPANYAFVFGWGPIPALGGAGCGLATTIVMWFMPMCLLVIMRLSPVQRHNLNCMLARRKPNMQLCINLLRTGLPLGLAVFFEIAFFRLLMLVIAPLGTVAVGAQQVAINLSGLVFMLPLSIGIAASIRAAYYVGKRDLRAFDTLVFTAGVLSLGLVACNMVLCYTCRHGIAACYTDDTAVASLAASLIAYCVIYQLSDSVQSLFSCLLRGCRDTAPITWICMITYWLIGFPLACILIRTDWIIPQAGPAGAWISFIVALTIAAILYAARFIRTRKRIFLHRD